MGRNGYNDLVIIGSGYIGIDNSNPLYNLHVVGNSLITGFITNFFEYISNSRRNSRIVLWK